MGTTLIWLLPMEFVKRLVTLRKERGLTQQALANAIDLHVNQIKRYEAGTAQPTLDTLAKLAKELHTTLDDLVFGEEERGPSDDLRLQFEALSQFDEEDRKVAKAVLESLILKHNAKRAFMDR
ncbi:MAG: helix-turn-helix domain-containing protein [Parahaliea sp.]